MNKKLCVDCGIPKDYSDFHSNKRNFDGKVNICKKCMKAVNADFVDKNKEKNAKNVKQRAESREEDAPKKAKITGEKICKDCLFKKDLSKFDDYKRGLDGKRRSCKKCTAKASAADFINTKKKSKARTNKINIESAKARADYRAEDKPSAEPTAAKKPCIKCHRSKKADEFFRDKNSKGGRVSMCKTCAFNTRAKIRRPQTDVDRLKKIFTVPVNPKYTQFYYMPKKPSVIAPLRLR